MLMSTANQAYVFLSTVYTGMILGLIYDLNRTIRRIFKPGRWLVGVLDLLFWLIAAAIVFTVLYFANNGEIRLYNFIGLAIGWSLYLLTISPWILKLLDLLYRGVNMVVSRIIALVSWPFRMIYNFLRKIKA
ncbi:MAG: spore cortex biosynthesis protein YabQ [Clostridiales bacterium]|nr:spore cortex biosynthesis protein YabQ [Clostridiales bacterium]